MINLKGKCGSCEFYKPIFPTAIRGWCKARKYGGDVAHDPENPYPYVSRSRLKCKLYKQTTEPPKGGGVMLTKANKCPKCNGTLLFECVGNYGDVFRVSKRTGKPGKERIRRAHYEYGDYMLYCTLCGTNFDFRFDGDGSLLLDFYEEVHDA